MESLLIKDKYHKNNIVFANYSAANWIAALSYEINQEHGSSFNQRAESAFRLFPKIQNKGLEPLTKKDQNRFFQKLFSGLAFSMSLYETSISSTFYHRNILGSISDFYYSIYHLFGAITFISSGTEPLQHRKSIDTFSTYIEQLPHPFNIRAQIDPSAAKTRNTIKKDDFIGEVPSLGIKGIVSDGNLNTPTHKPRFKDRKTAGDVLHGYLMGTVQYYLDEKKPLFRDHYKLKNIAGSYINDEGEKVDYKDLFNKKTEGKIFNFLDCTYRFRTKVHYRDILCYMLEVQDGKGFKNDYLREDFINQLWEISNFSCMVSLSFLKAKVGKALTKQFLDEVEQSMKMDRNTPIFWRDFKSLLV